MLGDGEKLRDRRLLEEGDFISRKGAGNAGPGASTF